MLKINYKCRSTHINPPKHKNHNIYAKDLEGLKKKSPYEALCIQESPKCHWVCLMLAVYCWVWGQALRVVCIPRENLLEKVSGLMFLGFSCRCLNCSAWSFPSSVFCRIGFVDRHCFSFIVKYFSFSYIVTESFAGIVLWAGWYHWFLPGFRVSIQVHPGF